MKAKAKAVHKPLTKAALVKDKPESPPKRKAPARTPVLQIAIKKRKVIITARRTNTMTATEVEKKPVEAPPPPKSVPPKVLNTPEAQEAKKALEEESKAEEHPTSLLKLVEDATKIPDEAAFQVYAAVASVKHPGFVSIYERFCKAEFGYVPLRLQNLPDDNVFRVAAGPASVRAISPIPDGLTQCDIALLNAGVPLDVVKPKPAKDQKAIEAKK